MNNRKLRIVYVISKVEKSVAFEWLALALKKDYDISFVLLNPASSPLEEFLISRGIEVKRLIFTGKKDYPAVFFKLWAFLLSKRPDIVHAHLLDAQLLGLGAGWAARIRKRIYTRHNSDFHHVYFPSGIKYDQLSNCLSTHIISISQATDRTLNDLERVKKQKIRKIYHGFELSWFGRFDDANIRRLRSMWRIPDTHPIVGVIARHIEWKGVQHIIPAFAQLLDDYPSAILVMANAIGPFHKQLLEQLRILPKSSYVLIPFHDDVVSLYAIFDLYVHVPVNGTCEAFGQTYVEALAAGVPSVFTLSGVAAEFIHHKKNAWVVDFENPDEIYQGMTTLLKDVGLQQKLIQNGRSSVGELFTLPDMISKLQALYDE